VFTELIDTSLSKDIKFKIYKTKILPLILYGYGTWPLILIKEHCVCVCERENKVLRKKIFGPKSDEA
jgi:hypothetical protein